MLKNCQCVNQSLPVFFRTALNLPDGIPAMVMVIHTYGDYARWHPHIHVLIADGLFRKNGIFYVMPKCCVQSDFPLWEFILEGDEQLRLNKDIKPLKELFRAGVDDKKLLFVAWPGGPR